MSYAPKTITALGTYWTNHGGVNLGIVGNQKHCSGYHLGKDRIFSACACRPDGTCEPGQYSNDYSVRLARDKAGLSDAVSAIDFGKLNGTLANLYAFSEWLVDQCQKHRSAYRDIREVIYWSVRNARVQRYSGEDGEVHWGPGNGDASHKTHTHISFYRDSVGREKVPLVAPYFNVVPPDTSTGEPEMKTFLVPELRTLAKLKDGAWLYRDSSLAADPGNIRVSPSRELVYVGRFSDAVRIVAYEPPTEDAGTASAAMFVNATDIASTRTVTDGGYTQAQLDAAVAKAKANAQTACLATVKAETTTAYNKGLEAAAAAVAAVPRR